jgi:hypothetical protein
MRIKVVESPLSFRVSFQASSVLELDWLLTRFKRWIAADARRLESGAWFVARRAAKSFG